MTYNLNQRCFMCLALGVAVSLFSGCPNLNTLARNDQTPQRENDANSSNEVIANRDGTPEGEQPTAVETETPPDTSDPAASPVIDQQANPALEEVLPTDPTWRVFAELGDGKSNGYRSAAFSFDGQVLAVANGDVGIDLWDMETKERLARLPGEGVVISSIAFSPDGCLIASAEGNFTVRIWDAVSHDLVTTLEGDSRPFGCVAFGPDNQTVAAGDEDGIVWIWNITEDLEPRKIEGHSDIVSDVAFSPDGTQLATASWDQSIRIWDVATGEPLMTLEDQPEIVTTLSYRPDGKMLASGHWNHTIQLWDVLSGEMRGVLQEPRSGVPVYDLAFNLTGEMLVSVGSDQKTHVHELQESEMEFKPVTTILEGHDGTIYTVAFHPDGKKFATAGRDDKIRLWEKP